jgi:hypothetical protein
MGSIAGPFLPNKIQHHWHISLNNSKNTNEIQPTNQLIMTNPIQFKINGTQ